MHHRVVEKERLCLVRLQKRHGLLVHDVRHVLFVGELKLFAVGTVCLNFTPELVLIDTAAIEAQVVVKACLIGLTRKLPPLANRRGRVARRLKRRAELELRERHALAGILVGRAIAKRIAPRHDQRPRRPTERRRKRPCVARARSGELVYIRCLGVIRAVAPHVSYPQIIGQNKDYIGFLYRHARLRRARKYKSREECTKQECSFHSSHCTGFTRPRGTAQQSPGPSGHADYSRGYQRRGHR